MDTQAFWDLTNFSDTVDKINSSYIGLSVYDLCAVDSSYSIVEDDTHQEVLIKQSNSNITFDMLDKADTPYEVTSVKCDFWGTRPHRPT